MPLALRPLLEQLLKDPTYQVLSFYAFRSLAGTGLGSVAIAERGSWILLGLRDVGSMQFGNTTNSTGEGGGTQPVTGGGRSLTSNAKSR